MFWTLVPIVGHVRSITTCRSGLLVSVEEECVSGEPDRTRSGLLACTVSLRVGITLSEHGDVWSVQV